MAERIKFQKTDEEAKILEQAIRHDEGPEVRQRATAIRMLHLGHHPTDVAKSMAVSLPTLYNWHARWQEAGVAGLANRPKSGCPAKADEKYCRVLEETLAKEPPELGYAFTVWTVKRLRDHLERQTGIDLSEGFIDGTFAPAKKGAMVWAKPKRAKEPKLWALQTLSVFLSPLTQPVLTRMK